jgi:hypothetical protein
MNINLDSIDVIQCPVCHLECDIYNYFTHIYQSHEEFLAVWSGLAFPRVNPDDAEQLVYLLQTLGVDTPNFTLDQLENQLDQYNDDLTYEALSALCDEVGYHTIGVTNIDDIAPATVRMKKSINEDTCCPICLENIFSAVYIRQISLCHHEFCGECIEKWLNNHKTCPICKSELEPEESTHGPISESPPLNAIMQPSIRPEDLEYPYSQIVNIHVKNDEEDEEDEDEEDEDEEDEEDEDEEYDDDDS